MNTAFSYLVYALALLVGLNYALASLIAVVAGVFFSFRTQGTLVFGNADNRLLGRFAICWAVIYGANVLLIKTIMLLGANPYVAGAAALAPITIVSYFVQKFVVFRRADHSTHSL